MVGVEKIMSLTHNGLFDWLIQRVTAVLMGLYVFFILGFLILHPNLQFADWHGLFSCGAMRIFSFLVLLSIVTHSWVGIWTVLTDYVKCFYLRLSLEILMILALLSYLALGIKILWGI